MKHLTKFIEYIKENKVIDLALLESEYLIPITHLGIKPVLYKKIITEGEFSGYDSIIIPFSFEHFNSVDDESGSPFLDNKIWEFLDELLMLKNVIDSYGGNKVGIYFNQNTITITIYIKREKEDNEYLLKKLYREITKTYNKKIHFNFFDESDIIKIYVSGTKRVWDNHIKNNDIDLSKFDVEITDSDSLNTRRWNSKLTITLSPKVK